MSGGQATNAGINYQQRVSAFFLVCLFADFDIADYLDVFDEPKTINKIFFETDTPIDDLVLECNPSSKLFFQIKRSLSLSVKSDSEFAKTIKQFVVDFCNNPLSHFSRYGIITSSISSKKITYELKKILTSVRLNDNSFVQNPLNNSEKDTLSKFRELFFDIFENVNNKAATQSDFLQFSQRCFVNVLDIEAGEQLEVASCMLLNSVGFPNPELIWAVLIKNSLSYASQRLSVEKEYLTNSLERYLKPDENTTKFSVDDFLKTEIIAKGEYSAGRDLLLIESFSDDFDYMRVELRRFDDKGNRRYVFYDDKIQFNPEKEWTVIQRFATSEGLDRYILDNKEKLAGGKLCIINSANLDFVDDSVHAILHRQHLNNLQEQNTSILTCLHCDKGVNSGGCIVVEINDIQSKEAVGIVHNECLRPIDRVLGKSYFKEKEYSENLSTFDFKTWVRLCLKGQGMMNSFRASPNWLGLGVPMLWNSNIEYDREYSYCIRFTLEDGTFEYDFNRGKIFRLNKSEARNKLIEFKKTIKKAKDEKNPMCYTSIKRIFGHYSMLLELKDDYEDIIEITTVEIVRYSNQIAKLFDNDFQYYAPLCLVMDKESELIWRFMDIIPLVSDPLTIDRLIDNWKKSGIDIKLIELKIIKSDKDFDNWARMIFAEGMTPIIDPMFDMNGNLVKGLPIHVYDKFIERLQETK